uniref:Transmembrane protein n=1 Tax=Steinernema glaseri TaxID=37863 RepID=A0A1I7ZG32_9BILA
MATPQKATQTFHCSALEKYDILKKRHSLNTADMVYFILHAVVLLFLISFLAVSLVKANVKKHSDEMTLKEI